MTPKRTTIGRRFNAKALAATALLSSLLALPFNTHADGPTAGATPTPIEQMTTTATDTVSPSYFEPDADGVLWFQQGTDGKGPFSMAGNLSEQMEGIVILIATNPQIADKALAHGKRLQEYLQKHPKGPGAEKVIIAINVRGGERSGTFYYFNVLGPAFSTTDMGEHEAAGRFGPKSAATVVPKVIVDYLAAMQMKADERASISTPNADVVAVVPTPR